MNYRLIAAFFLTWFPFSSNSQDLRSMVIPVVKSGKLLSNPWVGGFNTPQLASADLNRDGVAPNTGSVTEKAPSTARALDTIVFRSVERMD